MVKKKSAKKVKKVLPNRASKKVINKENKQLAWFFLIVVLVFSAFLGAYLYNENSKLFEFAGAEWTIEEYEHFTAYHGRFLALDGSNSHHNIWLRKDPRENLVPAEGIFNTFKYGVSVWPYFLVVLILNILVIFFIFFFLDFLHKEFMRLKIYKKIIARILNRIQKKADKVEKRLDDLGYVALMLFVAIPLPGTGAWSGTLVAWLLGLDRLKSFIAIALGVIIAGFLILLFSLGLSNWFY
jgi:uncharacterized membrane protein